MRASSSSFLAGSVRGLAFQLPALVLGPLWLSLLATGWSVTLGFAVTPLVIPAALGTVLLVRLAARLEAALCRSLLGADAQVPELPKPRGFWRRIWATVSERWIWRAQGWLVLRMTAGFALAVALVSSLAAGLGLLSAPLWYWAVSHGTEIGAWRIDSLGRAVAVMPIGAVALALALVLARAANAPSRALANATLGTGSTHPSGGPGAPGDPVPAGGPGARRALVVHAIASGGPRLAADRDLGAHLARLLLARLADARARPRARDPRSGGGRQREPRVARRAPPGPRLRDPRRGVGRADAVPSRGLGRRGRGLLLAGVAVARRPDRRRRATPPPCCSPETAPR